jgi:hypothetical protein
MSTSLAKRTLEGALAGFAGTALLQGLVIGAKYLFPQADAPETEDPASFMLWQVEKRLPQKLWMSIPPTAETAAGYALSFGYGATFGALYGALRPQKGCTWVDGVIVGTACWAVGYLGWLPAAKLMPPVWRQTPTQIAGPVIEHLAFGIATVAAYELITRRW